MAVTEWHTTTENCTLTWKRKLIRSIVFLLIYIDSFGKTKLEGNLVHPILNVFSWKKNTESGILWDNIFYFFLEKEYESTHFTKDLTTLLFGQTKMTRKFYISFFCINLFECLNYFLVYIFSLGKRIVNRVPQTVKKLYK